MAKAYYMNERRMVQQWDIRGSTSSSVIVRNLSPATTEETIIIHFQKRKNGGGEVEGVRLLSEGVAVVTFETSQVAESVLTRRHEIDGVPVALERNRQSCPDKIFGKVAGRLDPLTFGVSFSRMEAILQTIQDETNVDWKKIFDGFVVSGTFEQIKKVHNLLNSHLQRKKQHSEESTQKYSSLSMIRDASTMRQSTAGRKTLTGPTTFRAPTDFAETIEDMEVRPYSKPLTSEKSHVKEYTSYGNPRITESDFHEKLKMSETEKANDLGQQDITRNALRRVIRGKDSHKSSTRANNGKPPDQEVKELKSDGESLPAAVAPPVVKEKENKATHLKTRTGVDVDAYPLSLVSEVRDTSNADGKRLSREETKDNGDAEDRHLDNIKGKPHPLLYSLTTGIPKQNDSCENVQIKSTSNGGNYAVEKSGSILPAVNETCVQSQIPSTGANSRNPQDKKVIGPISSGENRLTAVTSSVEKEMILSKDNKHLQTATDVNVNALTLPQVSEVKDASKAYGRPQDREESKENTAVKDRQMAPDNNKGKTEPLVQCLVADILKQNQSLENAQSESSSADGNSVAENSSSILPALKEACAQETEFCTDDGTPKSADVLNISKEKGKYTLNGNSLNYITSTGVTVTLLKGEIACHDVNVLVCPANPTLTYEEGLSKRILEKGGQDIVGECLGIIQTEGPLEYGTTCFTSSGKLPCRVVLHAILPPWIKEEEKKKECKVQIHRCLKDGLALASGYRYRSVAFPPLGQEWNCIPLEVSAEIITRVIAVFSKNIGPMHSGINDFRIICEDDPAIDTFVKEFTSFSFPGEKPFFVFAATKNKFSDVDQIVKSQSVERNHSGYDQQADSSISKVRAVKKMQEATSSPESDYLSDTKSAEIHTRSPKIETPTSSHPRASESLANLPSITGANEAVSLSNTNQSCEIAVTFFSSSCIESAEILEAKALEILEVTKANAVGLQEETTKRVTVQDNTKTELSKQLNLNQNKEGSKSFVVETSELSEESAAPDISKAMTHEVRQLKPPHLQTHNQQNEVVLASEGLFGQKSAKEATSLQPWPADQETSAVSSSSLSSLRINGAPFVTSPTVEALLNADLLLGFQGLQIGQDTSRQIKNNEDRYKGKGNDLPVNQKKDDSYEKTSIPSCDATSNGNHSNQVTVEHSKKDINGNLETEMAPANGKTDNIKGSVPKCDFEEAKETKYDFPSAALVENYHNSVERKVSTEQQNASLCALCQDTVDHPDLIHPNACAEHKFCDDCILKAFNFSNNCPACVDTYGLLTSKLETNVDHTFKATKGLHHPVSTLSSTGSQEDISSWGQDSPWAASLDFPQANQPPGQMMWKRYKDNLPGFEGFGTIVITYNFYDGIQTSEHPSPGESYTGMSCLAYLPDTQEGKLVFKLLRKAFDARLVFTVSKSALDGTGHVELNGVDLKTAFKSDARNGYPDSGYLSRIRKQLAAKGIH